jgi:hypothetical protein
MAEGMISDEELSELVRRTEEATSAFMRGDMDRLAVAREDQLGGRGGRGARSRIGARPAPEPGAAASRSRRARTGRGRSTSPPRPAQASPLPRPQRKRRSRQPGARHRTRRTAQPGWSANACAARASGRWLGGRRAVPRGRRSFGHGALRLPAARAPPAPACPRRPPRAVGRRPRRDRHPTPSASGGFSSLAPNGTASRATPQGRFAQRYAAASLDRGMSSRSPHPVDDHRRRLRDPPRLLRWLGGPAGAGGGRPPRRGPARERQT